VNSGDGFRGELPLPAIVNSSVMAEMKRTSGPEAVCTAPGSPLAAKKGTGSKFLPYIQTSKFGGGSWRSGSGQNRLNARVTGAKNKWLDRLVVEVEVRKVCSEMERSVRSE